MSDMKFENRDPNVLAGLKQRFPAMDTVERLLTETRMRLWEALDGELLLDEQTCTLRIWSRKTRTSRTVSISPELAELLRAFLKDAPANRRAMIMRALRAFGPSYRRSLSRLRYRGLGERRDERRRDYRGWVSG